MRPTTITATLTALAASVALTACAADAEPEPRPWEGTALDAPGWEACQAVAEQAAADRLDEREETARAVAGGAASEHERVAEFALKVANAEDAPESRWMMSLDLLAATCADAGWTAPE